MSKAMNTADKPSAPLFPFSAIVGQEEMKRALIFNAIDPSIGGLLITGTRGTAKSTAARAIAALLPEIEVITGDAFNNSPVAGETAKTTRIPTPFVNLPVGATEDRVLGTLDVERVLQSGERHFEPGLLARANRGVLYVDEVNLLPDHLVDVLLDAVAMGVNRVEREGVSFTHDARVILIGTMNPEEGELRPQLLDRFALCASVSGYFDPDLRKEVIRRRMAFEANPNAHIEQWKASETELSQRIERARELLDSVQVPEGQLDAIVEACAEAKADGLRADIVAYKTSRAIAAFAGRNEVNSEDVTEGLALALAHRRRSPRPTPPAPKPPPPPDGRSNAEPPQPQNQTRNQGSSPKPSAADEQSRLDDSQANEGNQESDSQPSSIEERTFAIGDAVNVSRAISPRSRRHVFATVAGKGTFAPSLRSGQFVRAVMPRESERLDLAVEATLRAAAVDVMVDQAANAGTRDPEQRLRLRVRREHWRHKQRRVRTRNLILLLVDASGSMAARQRMQAAKGAIVSLLEDSYQKRDWVALIAFRGETAIELLPPTRSVVFAYRQLAELPTGGRTPLAEGLSRTRQVIERQARKGERVLPYLVLITDGRATVPEVGAMEAALGEASRLRQMQVRGLCLDMESGRVRFGQVRTLATGLYATYTHVQDLPPKDWGRVIHEWVASKHQGGGAFVGN
jgi:magnesium chelatase subunit D